VFAAVIACLRNDAKGVYVKPVKSDISNFVYVLFSDNVRASVPDEDVRHTVYECVVAATCYSVNFTVFDVVHASVLDSVRPVPLSRVITVDDAQ
jgi:hypothetical protein